MTTNNITIEGSLGKDPELAYTSGGRAVAKFSVAVEHRFKRGDEWESETTWHNVVAWGDLGENCAASLSKGSRVVVAGRFAKRGYEDKNGEKRTADELVADAVGASLRWATAQIERTERDASPSRPAAKRQPDPIYGNDEPF